MTPELQKRLQDAWKTPPAKERKPTEATTVVSNLASVRAGGVAIERCSFHIPPFDAIEWEDPQRPGYIRSDCRLCGCFLGYRPKDNRLHFEGRG
jgi:hypothetical protein